MPPKHDLRGGRASADSFAMSSNIFVASTSRCFFAVGSHEVGTAIIAIFIHELGPIPVSATAGRRFRRRLAIVQSRGWSAGSK
jgi:hypothetical protein